MYFTVLVKSAQHSFMLHVTVCKGTLINGKLMTANPLNINSLPDVWNQPLLPTRPSETTEH